VTPRRVRTRPRRWRCSSNSIPTAPTGSRRWSCSARIADRRHQGRRRGAGLPRVPGSRRFRCASSTTRSRWVPRWTISAASCSGSSGIRRPNRCCAGPSTCWTGRKARDQMDAVEARGHLGRSVGGDESARRGRRFAASRARQRGTHPGRRLAISRRHRCGSTVAAFELAAGPVE
jgi:hypothetical protein